VRLEDYGTPQDYRRLASAFLTVLAALAILAAFDAIVVPGMRAGKGPAGGPDAPIGVTGWLDVAEQPPTRGYQPPPVDLRAWSNSSPELVARGRVLFAQVCAPCHGEQGDGQGPAASSLKPPPRNFTSPVGWKDGYGLVSIFKTISDGVPGSAMASFDYLSPKDRMALTHVVISLGRFAHPRQSAEFEKLARTFKVARVPNKIPVSLAMRKLAAEAAAPPSLPLGGAAAAAIEDSALAASWLERSLSWRAGPAALAAAACAQAPGNGFAVAAAELPAKQWEKIYAELIAWRRR
jgi:mono/diheme cytochrome c family protein